MCGSYHLIDPSFEKSRVMGLIMMSHLSLSIPLSYSMNVGGLMSSILTAFNYYKKPLQRGLKDAMIHRFNNNLLGIILILVH